MLTPQFAVRQDHAHVYVDISIASLRSGDLEVYVRDELFVFSMSPYYLRLRFPCLLKNEDDEEDEDERQNLVKVNLNVSLGTAECRLCKRTPGEEFPDLDMLTLLLARKKPEAEGAQGPLIQELNDSSDLRDLQRSAQEFDWEIEQHVTMDDTESTHYGFADQYQNLMQASVMNGNDVNELEDPDHSTLQSRVETRLAVEAEAFDAGQYCADLDPQEYAAELIGMALKYRFAIPSAEDFDADQKLTMTTYLPTKGFLMNAAQTKRHYVSVVGILFAYVYELRCNDGDMTVNSAWSIGKMCPLVACLDNSHTSVRSLMVTCSRRALCFPMIRRWDLVMMAWTDVAGILEQLSDQSHGKRIIIKIILAVIAAFNLSGDLYHVYNKLWFYDYASWLQSTPQAIFRSLAHEVRACELTKSMMDLDLEKIEATLSRQQNPDSDDDDDDDE